MSPHLIAILVLVGVFLLGTVRSVNLGVLALVGAFGVGTWVFGVSTADVLADFPADLFVILVGVTFLFAIAKRNGTVDWLVGGAVRAVRGRVAALPWVMFVLSDTMAEPCGYLDMTQTRDGRVQLITSRNHYVFNLAWLHALPEPAR